MRMHCAHARFVWNLALEQYQLARQFGTYPDQGAWFAQLTDARQAVPWLASGSHMVQQQALRDLRQTFKNWWLNPGHFGPPRWRKAGCAEGFHIVHLVADPVSARWAVVRIPKAGRVRFRLTRPIPPDAKSARVTLDRSGRWHLSIVSDPPQVEGPDSGEIVGIDRGVTVPFQCSDGRSWDVAGLRPTEAARLRRLQRRMSRQQTGSNRRARTKLAIARVKARETDRRRDSIEKATTELARTADLIRIEDLRVKNMTRSARGTIENPGRNVRAKAGLNRAIQSMGWTLFATRLEDKIGTRLERVPAAFTSQRCHECGHTCKENRESQAVFRCRSCGHTSNADLNAAKNIAAGYAVTARGGPGAVRPTDETRTISSGRRRPPCRVVEGTPRS